MRAGLLNKKIKILRPTIQRNEYNEEVETYNEIAATRARVIYNNGQRSLEVNSEVHYDYQLTFEVWKYVDIKENDYIEFLCKKYRVISIEISDEQNKKIIRVDEVNE